MTKSENVPKMSIHPYLRKRKNAPKETAFYQQSLPSLRPSYTASTVLPFTAFLGIVFVSVGLAMYFGALDSLEYIVDYTDCVATDGSGLARDVVSNASTPNSVQCSFLIFLDTPYEGDNVNFLYGLKGFYQNTRQYLASRNDLQLAGDIHKVGGCSPLDYSEVIVINNQTNGTSISLPIAPCGFIANSMFNDTFELFYHTNEAVNETERVPFTGVGIISDLEMKRKFSNPPYGADNITLCDAFNGTAKPPWWSRPICELGKPRDEEEENVGLGMENVDLMVWMKTAALPTFRKMYRKLDTRPDLFRNGLPVGNYTLLINYNYPVKSYSNKTFVITRESWVGPRKFFLPIAYLITGTFLLLVSIALLVISLRQRFCSNEK